MKLSEQPGWGFLKAPAKILYLIYSFSCHQFSHRSLHVADYQCAWCARDVGIWGGILAGALASRTGKLAPLPWYWTLPFIVPMALDGGIQTIATVSELDSEGRVEDPVYVSNNLTRFVTGMLFGVGLSLFISPNMRNIFWESTRRQFQTSLKSGAEWWQLNWRLFTTIIVVMMTAYVAMVGIWQVTSTKYLPSDWLDSAVKTPAGDFFERRGNGPCPANQEDILQLKCLTTFSD